MNMRKLIEALRSRQDSCRILREAGAYISGADAALSAGDVIRKSGVEVGGEEVFAALADMLEAKVGNNVPKPESVENTG